MSPNEDYQPCAKRTQLTAFAKNGTKAKVQRCTEKTAEHNGLNVLPSDCEGCPVRAIVTRKAMQEQHYQPPLFADIRTIIAKKKDTDPPKEWPKCIHRDVVQAPSCCGATQEHRVCDSIDCFRIGSEVNAEICRACVYRKDQ